jgi:hypothetical protein
MGILQYFYLFLTRNNSFWVFSEPEKQVCRFTMVSRSISFIFLHVVEEQRGVMDIWCTSGLHRLRREPSITRRGLDADQWCVLLSMRSQTVYGKKFAAPLEDTFRICAGAFKNTNILIIFSSQGELYLCRHCQSRICVRCWWLNVWRK